MTKEQMAIMREIQKTLRLLDDLLEEYMSNSNESKSDEEVETKREISLDELVQEYLYKFCAHRTYGYKYLKLAIKMAVKDRYRDVSEMYPIIAEKYDTRPRLVANNIDAEIQRMYYRYMNEELEKVWIEIFGDIPKIKPANKEFITTVANYIRMNEMR